MIEQYGWSDLLETAFAPHARAGHTPGRVILQQRDGYLVVTDEGELRAKASGRLLHEAKEIGHPAVGDWVALALNPQERTATIHAILPRRTAFVRRAAHSTRGLQIIAANIDVAFVVTSMNADLNPRRIQRYLAAAWQSGARPVVVLTKSDLCDDPQAQAAEIAALETGCPVLVVSARQGLGLDALLAQVKSGETCVLIGSSGVGKSSLVNAFLNENRMATQAIREDDDQGRHTTSHRELILLPGGGMILDTPGIREVGLIDADEGVSAVFDDIERLPQDCRFNDCSHANEPGCAVRAALQSGALDPDRWAHFQKLKLELAASEEKAERTAKDAERRRLAALQKRYRATKRNDRGSQD
ncbi:MULTISPECIES: ribosome small subunit-dependent GTPase A [unclassified Brevundimonas]|uniref:ribosome small subunit-dependent GTPase A n=1 Tax=unclassified Brevundimonas TaxID=2622653 RepID=UPI003F92441B